MDQSIQPSSGKTDVKETIKMLEIIHLISNIFSGGFLGVIVIALYLAINKEMNPELK